MKYRQLKFTNESFQTAQLAEELAQSGSLTDLLACVDEFPAQLANFVTRLQRANRPTLLEELLMRRVPSDFGQTVFLLTNQLRLPTPLLQLRTALESFLEHPWKDPFLELSLQFLRPEVPVLPTQPSLEVYTSVRQFFYVLAQEMQPVAFQQYLLHAAPIPQLSALYDAIWLLEDNQLVVLECLLEDFPKTVSKIFEYLFGIASSTFLNVDRHAVLGTKEPSAVPLIQHLRTSGVPAESWPTLLSSVPLRAACQLGLSLSHAELFTVLNAAPRKLSRKL